MSGGWPPLTRGDALGVASIACRVLGEDNAEHDLVDEAERMFIARTLVGVWQVVDADTRASVADALAEHGFAEALRQAQNLTWSATEIEHGLDDLLAYLAEQPATSEDR